VKISVRKSKGRWISASALALGCVLIQAAPVAAQDGADQGTEEPNEILVIGTGTNISGVKPVGSEAILLDREDIVKSGLTTAADVVRTLPQVRNLGDYREGGTQGTGNSQQGNAINLRGLGEGATLTLVDGHRVVATGAAQNFTEANRVPLAALERIEVIADGASAIYGSDAVAGVVNYVLRKDYEGVEASFRASNQSGSWEWAPSITAGTAWEAGGLGPGNILLSYEYSDRAAYLRGDNIYLRQDLSSLGGPDGRLNGTTATAGLAPNIYVPNADGSQNPVYPRAGANTYYGLPTGANEGLTVADLRLNDANLLDSSDYTDYSGAQKRHQLVAFINQSLGENVELFVQGTYMHRSSFSRTGNTLSQNVTLSPTLFDEDGNATATPNPYYISGIPGVAPGSPINVQYNAYKDIGASNFDVGAETYSITGGFRADLMAGWKGEIYYTYGRDDACNYCQTGLNVNNAALQYLINIGEINPLSSEPLSQDIIARFTGDNIQSSGNGMDDIVLKFDGPLFELPAGLVRAAVGGERNKMFNYNVNGANRNADNQQIFDTTAAQSRLGRTVWSAFGEIYLPIVSEDMDVPLMRDLAISAAVRYDDYSDVGSTTNPKFGATWEVNDVLSLRGSWGTSFRAPSLPDVNPYAFSLGLAFPSNNADPRVTNGFLDVPGARLANLAYVFGSNPDLKPETATTWSLGADIDAGPVRTSLTYYNVSYEGRIQSPDALAAYQQGLYPDYNGTADFIIPINNPVTCSNADISSADPLLQTYLGQTILYGGITNFCAVNVLVDGRYTNLAATRQDGLDATINYGDMHGEVFLNASLSANVVFNNKQQVAEGQPFVDRLGYYSTPIKWRGRGSLGANWKGFSSTLFANYTGSYINDLAVDSLGNSVADQKVGANVTFDLTLGYDFKFSEPAMGVLRNVRANVSVINLFDRDPQLAFTSQSAINAAYSSPFGRTVTFQLTTQF